MKNDKNFLLIDFFFILLMVVYIYYDHLPNKLEINFLIIDLIFSYGIILFLPVVYLKNLRIRRKKIYTFCIFQVFYFYTFIVFLFSEFKQEVLIYILLNFVIITFFSTRYKYLGILTSVLGHIFFVGIFFYTVFALTDNSIYNSFFIIIFMIITFSFIKKNIKNEVGRDELIKLNKAAYLYYLHGLIYIVVYDYIHVTIFHLFY